ncbi:pyridoxamine 5'-phosphate oxidase-related, FMN-binding [Rhodopseudomonas palustris BisB5]|uniref:Pyridoxamine 5'-phosphate oxidase-related, FMN-binding n=1 Tax=Rhodopseudomonas palustris (strain BisB5) TaxID=316057 RepID=Q13E85_RHOPS|nr:pyridoxamine 5'-phosphate oxidase-related, FMN-binding [Rhodopseudomonas palustris BisB5]
MQPTADFNPTRVAKSLLRRRREGALATLLRGSGGPFCSLVNLATAPDGAPILLISRLAVHTKNLLADPRMSLMLDERAEGDPLEGARIMLLGTALEARPADVQLLRRRYLAAHPGAEAYIDFTDFSLFTIETSAAHLVAGFGRIVDLAPADFLTDLGGAAGLLDAEPSAVDHMNVDHLDTLNLYATKLIGAGAADWRCTGVDPEGLDLQAGRTTLRLDFLERVTTAAGLRDMLKRMADIARSAA